MTNKFYVLTDKGFLQPSNLKGRDILLSSGLYKKHTKDFNINTFYKKTRLVLYTGTEIAIESSKKIKGLTFNSNEIKNDLEILSVNEYKLDDYIYTPFINLNFYPKNTQFNLTEYLDRPVTDKHRIYYISKALYSEYNDNGFTMFNLLSVLTGKSVKQDLRDKVVNYLKTKKVNLEDTESVQKYLTELMAKCTKTMLSTLSINKRLMDYLIISTLRGEVQHFVLQNNVVFKTLSYKFNKGSEYHEKMYDDLLLFLRGLDIEYEEKEYDHYVYLNISCEPLIGFYEKFKQSNFYDLRKFSSIDTKYFINTLYKYTNNAFYSNLDTYLNLKEHAYYNKIILGYTDKLHSNYDSLYPINSFILEEPELTSLEIPDIIQLEEGYLVRITNISTECTQGDHDLIEDVMVIC